MICNFVFGIKYVHCIFFTILYFIIVDISNCPGNKKYKFNILITYSKNKYCFKLLDKQNNYIISDYIYIYIYIL